MLNSDSNQKPLQAGAAQFTNTHWSVVLAAREDDSTQASAALEKLCRAYWYPLYAFIRRQGASAHDAQDVTQAFFAHLLKIDFLRGVAPAKGKFRSFLLASLKNFLADERDRAAALKRGGGQKILSLDDDTAWFEDTGYATTKVGNGVDAKVTFDGSRYIIIAAQHQAGLWRYVEP